MTKYNQIKIQDSVLVEVTDQTVYLEKDSETTHTAIPFTYDEFENIHQTVQNKGSLTIHSNRIETKSGNVIIRSEDLELVISSEEFERVYDFFINIQTEVRGETRKAVVVFEGSEIVEVEFASSTKEAKKTVSRLKRMYTTKNHSFKIQDANKFRN